MAQPRHHFQFLDTIRGIAILAVFGYHCVRAAYGYDQLPWNGWVRDFAVPPSFLALLPLTFGWAGVAIFFVVSGFCIHLSFIKGPPDWRAFFVRRFFRIYPPYVVAVLVFAFLLPTSRLSFDNSFSWTQLVSHLLLLHNFNNKTAFGINPSLWSIATEVQLYLIYPLLIALVSRIGWKRALTLLGALEILIRGGCGLYIAAAGITAPYWVHFSPLTCWFSWSVGAAIAEAWVQQKPLPFRSAPPVLWILLLLGADFIKPLQPYSFLLFAVLTATIISGLLRHDIEPQREGLLLAHLRLLGMWSYSFYLLHQPIIVAASMMLHSLPVGPIPPFALFLLLAGTYPLILSLSASFYRYFELPSITLGKRLLPKVASH